MDMKRQLAATMPLIPADKDVSTFLGSERAGNEPNLRKDASTAPDLDMSDLSLWPVPTFAA